MGWCMPLSGWSAVQWNRLKSGRWVPGDRYTDGCSGNYPTSISYDIRAACANHDYGWDLIRAGSLPYAAEIDVDRVFRNVMRREVCNHYGWAIQRADCRRMAGALYGFLRTVQYLKPRR